MKTKKVLIRLCTTIGIIILLFFIGLLCILPAYQHEIIKLPNYTVVLYMFGLPLLGFSLFGFGLGMSKKYELQDERNFIESISDEEMIQEKSSIYEITKEEFWRIEDQFSNGRPLNFFTPFALGGVSFVALFANIFTKLHLIEKIPGWVIRRAVIAKLTKIQEGVLGKEITLREPLLGRYEYQTIDNGNFFIANENNGDQRIAVMITNTKPERAFIVARWHGKTGDEINSIFKF